MSKLTLSLISMYNLVLPGSPAHLPPSYVLLSLLFKSLGMEKVQKSLICGKTFDQIHRILDETSAGYISYSIFHIAYINIYFSSF